MSYYKTTNVVAIEAYNAWQQSIEAHRLAALQISAEVGASRNKLCRYRDGRFAALVFDDNHDIPSYFRRFKDYPSAYMPIRSIAAGKEIARRLSNLPKILPATQFNRAIGFNPCLISGMRLLEWPASRLVDGVLFFMVPDEAGYQPPAHVTEILGSEYTAVTSQQ